jgi:hypothetical protein
MRTFRVRFDAVKKRWIGSDDHGTLVGIAMDKGSAVAMVTGVANQICPGDYHIDCDGGERH